MDEATKRCTKCAEAKPLTEFWKDSGQASGLCPQCKVCRREAGRAYRQANADKLRERHKEWAAANPDKMKAAQREHAKRNRDERRRRAREAYAADPERGRGYTAKWRSRPEFAEYNRQASHRHRALKASATVVPFTQSQLAQRLAYFGGLCWICGGPGEQVDHVKPLSKGGAHCLANLRPACARCNNRKRAMWPLSQEVLQSRHSH